MIVICIPTTQVSDVHERLTIARKLQLHAQGPRELPERRPFC
jgi:hypothetical protein